MRPRLIRWLIVAAAAAGALYLFLRPASLPVDYFRSLADRYDVRILRDAWGVPHIFGKRDADVAFGLAYAHAEDDFRTIQGALLAARGQLATAFGREAAANDYMVQLLRIQDVVDTGYSRDLSFEARAICEAYADGLNYYAGRHPAKALPGLYPVTGKDVVAGFVHKVPLFFGLDRVLQALFSDTLDTSLLELREPPPLGSNTFAVAPRRSADGHTRLAINSHQPWEGPVAWYEAHLRSDEGWDMVGGVFPGAPVILHGHNRNLGWAHTVNFPDLIDVYELEIDPGDPNRYRFDGQWLALEVRHAPIKVRLFGPISWTVNREVLWSVHGPVVRRPFGTFAIRIAGFGEVRHIEQWYRMNKAQHSDAWLAAMRMQAIPMLNTGYADRDGNILYLYNARIPARAPGYDWLRVVPGNTSATLWQEYLSFDHLPSVRNPRSGFIQNCNSSPFRTTTGPGNPDPAAFDSSLGIETRITSRALRALELFGADSAITHEAFTNYKFDVAYSQDSKIATLLERLLLSPAPKDSLSQAIWSVLRQWDLQADKTNRQASLGILALFPHTAGDIDTVTIEAMWASLRRTATNLRSAHGRIDIEWAQVNRLIRGKVDLGLAGAPDMLRDIRHKRISGMRVQGILGDSYILLVEWDAEGRVQSRSIHQYGSATQDASSPHYADQAVLFAEHKLKPVWFDEADIRANLEAEYRPGAKR